MEFQLIDVLTEDDSGRQTVSFARVESVKNDLYKIRYLSPTKKANIYKFESETHDIELESIDYFYEDLHEFGFIEMSDGLWVKRTFDNSDSEYAASDDEEYETDSDVSLDEEESESEESPEV